MTRSALPRRLAAAAILLLWASVAAAEPLTVTAPADGDVLRGGSLARIAWTATALPRDVVEWEAFLSVDGGRYYATRITPHLDIDIRSFEWRVPNVSSNDVRLLIRIGDEREEKSVDVPLRLSIVADPFVRAPVARIAGDRGEPARPGDPGVALWASGDRDGQRIVHERAPVDAAWRTSTYAAPPADHVPAEAPVIATGRPAPAPASIPATASFARARSPLLARDILLLVRRRNI